MLTPEQRTQFDSLTERLAPIRRGEASHKEVVELANAIATLAAIVRQHIENCTPQVVLRDRSTEDTKVIQVEVREGYKPTFPIGTPSVPMT
jgi:hypothetical protein